MNIIASENVEQPQDARRKTYTIAFFGSSLVSAYWNGAATYFRGLIKALHARGHEVVFYEPDVYDRQKHRDLDTVPYADSVVYPVEDSNAALEKCLEAASLADIVVKASGVGARDEFLEERVLRLKRGQIRVFWDVDAPATLARLDENPRDPFHRCLPQYDCVLTYGGGDPVAQRYEAFGARMCAPIYNALDPDTHHPAPIDERFRSSLSFAGNRLPDREERVLDFFFGAAREAAQHRFLLAGNGWDQNAPELPNVVKLGHLYTRDHNAFNSSALAVLNVCRASMAENGYSPPTRFFEAAGAGACLITDYWKGVDEFLEPGVECFVARNGAEVAEILRGLNWDEARLMGSRARERLLANHTYTQRAVETERLFDLLSETSE